MPDIPILVRSAQNADLARMMRMRQHARRVVMHFGQEDLQQMIAQGGCVVAEAETLLWGFACAARQQPGLAILRGLGLLNGWRIDDGLVQLLRPLEASLRARGHQHLMHLAIDGWLAAPLARQRFINHDYIVHFERATPPSPTLPIFVLPDVNLRILAQQEIDRLVALDHQAFDWPWQFSRGELIKWLMTADRLVVLEHQKQLVGYACVQVHGEEAHLVRLAIAPGWQGQGFGRYLLADALDFSAARGAATITLNTQWHNTASQRLYKGFGFRAIGRRIPVLLKELV